MESFAILSFRGEQETREVGSPGEWIQGGRDRWRRAGQLWRKADDSNLETIKDREKPKEKDDALQQGSGLGAN